MVFYGVRCAGGVPGRTGARPSGRTEVVKIACRKTDQERRDTHRRIHGDVAGGAARGAGSFAPGRANEASGTSAKVQPASSASAADAAEIVRPVASASAGSAKGGPQIAEPVFPTTSGSSAGHAAGIEKPGGARVGGS